MALLEPAAKLEGGAGRANLGLALAYFANGAEAPARKALDVALAANAHYGKTLLGRIRRRVENVAGAMPGPSRKRCSTPRPTAMSGPTTPRSSSRRPWPTVPRRRHRPPPEEAGDAGKAEEADAG